VEKLFHLSSETKFLPLPFRLALHSGRGYGGVASPTTSAGNQNQTGHTVVHHESSWCLAVDEWSYRSGFCLRSVVDVCSAFARDRTS